MKRIVLVLLFVCSINAQNKVTPVETVSGAEAAGGTNRVFSIKYSDARQLMQLIGTFGARVSYSDRENMIAVHGTKETVDTIAEIISRLDVPRKIQNVELTIYLLQATDKQPSGSPLPATLDPVLKQLRGVFQYKEYRLLDTAFLRVRDGEGVRTAGSLNVQGGNFPSYVISMNHVRADSEPKEPSIRLEQLRMELITNNIPVTAIGTDIDIREGQKVVVGKSSLASSQDAVIMVISAKLVN